MAVGTATDGDEERHDEQVGNCDGLAHEAKVPLVQPAGRNWLGSLSMWRGGRLGSSGGRKPRALRTRVDPPLLRRRRMSRSLA
jgi:hypothetical protein